MLYGKGIISLGKGTYLGDYCRLHAGEGHYIRIGENVRIAHNVSIYTENGNKQGDVEIKDGAWIGVNVFIREGVTVGRNSIVGANAVVTHDVPDGETWGGIPARRLTKVKWSECYVFR